MINELKDLIKSFPPQKWKEHHDGFKITINDFDILLTEGLLYINTQQISEDVINTEEVYRLHRYVKKSILEFENKLKAQKEIEERKIEAERSIYIIKALLKDAGYTTKKGQYG